MLIKNFTNDKFIRAYNSFAVAGSQFHLNDEEFYIYSFLFTNQMTDGAIRTNIDIINQTIPIKFIKDGTKNKMKISKLIKSLIDKKVFNVENELSEIKNNSLLELSINNVELSNDGINDDKKVTDANKFQNFAKIPFVKFLEFTSTKDYYIYYATSRWSNGFKCSYSKWAEILGLKHQESALRVIEDAVDRKVIYKNTGDFTSINKQDVNTYSISLIPEAKKTNQTKKKEQIAAIEVAPVMELTEMETRKHNWNVKNSQLTEMDYYIYLTTKDQELKSKAKRRIDAIANSGEKGEGLIESLRLGAEYLLEQEEIKRDKAREQEQIQSATNAVKLKDETVVIVDEDNIDSIDWKQVKSLYYGEDMLQHEWRVEKFQPTNTKGYEVRLDMINYGLELYQEGVKQGKMLTHDVANKIQVKVFDDKYTSNENEYDQIDMMNQMEEVDSNRTKKSVPIWNRKRPVHEIF